MLRIKLSGTSQIRFDMFSANLTMHSAIHGNAFDASLCLRRFSACAPAVSTPNLHSRGYCSTTNTRNQGSSAAARAHALPLSHHALQFRNAAAPRRNAGPTPRHSTLPIDTQKPSSSPPRARKSASLVKTPAAAGIPSSTAAAASPGLSPSSSSQMSSSQSLPEACDVVIVGAGPAGLATALLLAQQQSPRWERIVLLEKRPSIDAEEADKSYTYMIDGRGFSLTDSAGVTKAVEAAGVCSTGLSISRVYPDCTYSERRFDFKDSSRASVWLPRRAFLRALHSGLAEAEQQGRVRIMYDAKVTNIELAAPGRGRASAAVLPIAVHVREAGGAGRELCFTPRLLVGADGAASEVRRALELWAPTAGLPEGTFSPVVLDSPSAGLRYKVLNVPPNPPFRTKQQPPQQPPQQQKKKEQQQEQATVSAGGSGSSHRVLPNSQFAMIPSIKAPRQRAMQLGMLPFRDPSSPRTANVIAPSDHVFWTLDTGEKLGAFLQESFPQLDVSALFNEQQLEAAAKSRGGSFPRPQYMRHFIAVLPYTPRDSDQQFAAAAAAAASSSCGVVLLGDAIHCFPPDLGQGVNSAMQDVMEFAKALHEEDGNLARALPLYEGRRAPEAAALAEIMTFGAPYQYSQDKIRRALWGLNVMLRMFLHRLAPKVFSQQTFVLIQQAEMSYAQIRDQVHATTRRIWALVGALAVALGALAVKFALAAGTGTLAVA